MAMAVENTKFEEAIKLIFDRGLEGMGPAMQILLNEAMVIERSRYTQQKSFCGRKNMKIVINSWAQRLSDIRQCLLKKSRDFFSKFFRRFEMNIISDVFVHDFP